MRVPPKSRWKATASSGAPRFAVDNRYATSWTFKQSKKAWLKIDLGKPATLGGLEVYWGKQAPVTYKFQSSADGKTWGHLCSTRHGEGGQDVFAFPPVVARIRVLDLQRAPTGAGSGDCRNQSLWPRRCGVGNRKGPHRGARAFPG